MNRSAIKLGLSATAVSALAAAGLPLLAGSANATPIDQQLSSVKILSQGGAKYANTATFDNDGTNTTVSLVASGPAAVTSIVFQYRVVGAADQTWKDINSVLARNADGVFTTEWAKPADVAAGQSVNLRAVPNTGEANAATDTVVIETGHPAIELATEGALGIYRNPLNGTGNVAVHGTTNDPAGLNDISVFDTIQDLNNNASYGHVNGLHSVKGDDNVWRFSGVLQYPANNYPYSSDTAPNQAVLTAAIDNTEDTEASTYYVQQVASVTATPKTTNVNSANPTTTATVTVLDGQGKPVAGATVGFRKDDNDPNTPANPTDTAQVGTTDADGKVTLTGLGQGTYTAYADTNGTAGYQAADISAAPFTISSYAQQVTAVSISATPDRAAFDFDELDDTAFAVTVNDQQGNGMAGEPVEYRWTVDPTAAGAPNASTAWTSGPATNASGKSTVPFTSNPASYSPSISELPAGTYTLEARRPNVQGTGLTVATPKSFAVNESEITFTDGASANAPLNGDYTVKGHLALVDGGASLADRTVTITKTGAGDSAFAPTAAQPAGTTVTGGVATAKTDANGNFSVVVRDPAVPPNVPGTPETATITAVASALVGNIGRNDSLPANDSADSEGSLTVNFQKPATVGRIDIGTQVLAPTGTGITTPGPGVPVDLDITVYGTDNDANPANDPKLGDVPVEVSVDKGFLSPNAETTDALTLAADHGDAGDLWGFFKNDGTDETVNTADAGAGVGTAGAVAAIEKDAGFDDDGLVTMTVTVKAGSVTKTEAITYDVRALLNATDPSFERAAGEPTGDVTVGDELDFQLYVHDQFGNLAGDEQARISDDSPIADFDTDEAADTTLTDFVNSGPGVTAFSDAPTTQTLTATMTPGAVTVNSTGDPAVDNGATAKVDSDLITWVAATTPDEPMAINARLTGSNARNGNDKVSVKAPAKAEGAAVKLFKVKANGKRVLVKQGTLNANGKVNWTVKDQNGKAKTKYVAKVAKTDLTKGDTSNSIRVK